VGEAEPIGNEGSGVVVASGGGMYANSIVGKNVGFTCNVKGSNSYGEYCVVNALKGCYPLPDDVPVEDAASHFVNPYTAYGFVDTVRSRHVASKRSPRPGFVHTAACSQLGQMLVKLCVKEGDITIINVVRRESQAATLRALGAEHIVNTAEEGWEAELKDKIKELGVQFAFDAVAGKMTGKLLSLLPNKGTCFVYGRLSNQPCAEIQPLDLIYRRKKLEGFFLTSWIMAGGLPAMYMRSKRATAAVHEGLAPGRTGPGAGWSRTQFEDCGLEGMFESFLDFSANGFTGRKLRVRMGETSKEGAAEGVGAGNSKLDA
jgi:NADPH2:quinone reductase